MLNEQLKIITGLLTIITAAITFYVFAEDKGLFFISKTTLAITSVFVSAHVAFFALFLSRRIERKRKNKRIFIIYSHKDGEAARELTKKLMEMGYNPWLDENEIIPGQNWNKAIFQAIENSSVALFLNSKNTFENKGAVASEIKAAKEVLRTRIESHSPIIPVLIEDVPLPKELAEIHAVKLYEENGIENLDKGLKYILNNNT